MSAEFLTYTHLLNDGWRDLRFATLRRQLPGSKRNKSLTTSTDDRNVLSTRLLFPDGRIFAAEGYTLYAFRFKPIGWPGKRVDVFRD